MGHDCVSVRDTRADSREKPFLQLDHQEYSPASHKPKSKPKISTAQNESQQLVACQGRLCKTPET